MSWLFAKIYDGFMEKSEAACLRDWRREILADAQGEVLEVGAGTGANLPLYPSGVGRLVASEPDPHMRLKLQDAVKDRSDCRVDPSPLGALRFDAGSFDVVVATLVLCSVPDPEAALADIHRVLRPGGRLLFLEHVAATDNPSRLAWQRRIEPIWKVVGEGCHLTRDTARNIERAGFSYDALTRASMRKALPWLRPTIRGAARKE